MIRYRLDPSVEFVDGGGSLLGGDPVRLLRLTDAGARVVAGWRTAGVEVGPLTSAGVRSLVDRLVVAGALHPEADADGDGPTAAEVEVVVPVRDRADSLGRCLDAVARTGVERVVVVDDGSFDVRAHHEVATRERETPGGAPLTVRLVRLDRSLGPAGARMAGFAVTAAPFVAFVDSDVLVGERWLGHLLGLFEDERVGLVAPRVRHVGGAGHRERYEAACSPLDLGGRRAPIVPGTRVSYVPAAALVVRRTAMADVGGFDVSMPVGEDVDLVWRLHGAGWACRYEPSAEVQHVGRTSIGEVLRRRADYGSSAAELERRHPGSLAPVVASPWSLVVVGAAASGHPVPAAGVATWTWWRLAARLGPVADARRVALRLVARGHLGAARQLARASVRPWLPLSLALAACSQRYRRLLPLAALVHPLLSWREHRAGRPVAWVVSSLADDIAYTAGVWAGCVRARSVAALVPRTRATITPSCQN